MIIMYFATSDDALEHSQGNSRYQKKLVLSLGLGVFSSSAYYMSLKYMFNNDGEISSFTNHYQLIDEFGDRTIKFKTLALAGVPLGLLLFSFLSDVFGRLTIIKYHILIQIFCILYSLIAFTTNILVFTSFFSGFALQSLILTAFILLYESNCASSKIVYTILILASSSLGLTFSSIFFYFAINWHLFYSICMVLSLISLFLIDRLYESIEFLINIGKVSEGIEVIKSIALENRKTEHDNQVCDLDKSSEMYSRTFEFIFRKNSAIFVGFLILMLNSYSIYLFLNMMECSAIENEYSNGIAAGLAEFLAVFVLILAKDSLELKQSFAGCIFIGRFLMILIYFLSSYENLLTGMILILRSMNNLEIYLIYFIAAKAFPCDVRCRALGIINALGIAGAYIFSLIIMKNTSGFCFGSLMPTVISFSSLAILSLVKFS